MQQKKPKCPSQVHVLTKRIEMRFIPKNKKLANQEAKEQTKLQNTNNQKSAWNIWSVWQKLRPSKKQIQQKQQQKNQPLDLVRSDSWKPSEQDNSNHESKQINDRTEHNELKYACKMSSQHILLGNQYQLDLINIGNFSSSNYVQVQYLWSIRKNFKITHVDTDTKKMNLLVIVAEKNVSIYRYDPRRVPLQTPIPIKEITLQSEPKFLKVLKDGHFGLFYQKHVQIYVVTDDVRRRFNRYYKIPKQLTNNGMNFALFLPPQMYQNVITIFFQEVKPPEQKAFNLWIAQLQFSASQIRQIPLQKMYQSKNKIKVEAKLSHYSKQVLLLSLGSDVLAIKKGYILDSVNVNMKTQECLLQYIGNETLLHIRHSKIQIYDFSIQLSSKPFKINVKSRDSIMLNCNENCDQYFKTIPVLTSDFLYIFQKRPGKNLLKKGQFKYFLYLTRRMSRDDKMKMIFPKSLKQFKIDDPILMDKCDMAQKMGYSVKQIYLQLWNRSSQSRSQDYSILIATRNYDTIKQEVIRKLKKQSMMFKQIINIQLACLAMLSQKIFSSQCTKQLLMDYISSHFFRRKLQMFKDIQLMQKDQREESTGVKSQQKLKMNIRQYQQYKAMEIKSQLIQYVNRLCHQNMKDLSKNIRFLLRNFKFVFRVIYEQLLQQIIKNGNINLLQLLVQIPEILPYLKPQTDRPDHIPVGFYEGVWPQISLQEWKQNLYVDAIVTIDNHEVVQGQLIKNVTFKRNWLSQHDMVTKSVQEIKRNYQRIKSEHTFYFFISKLFQYIQDRDILKKIVDYIEFKYSDDEKANTLGTKSMKPDQSFKSSNLKASMRSNKSYNHGSLIPGMPENLKGKVFLYQKIYQYFVEKNIAPLRNGQTCSLSQFFELKDYQLIRYCFEKQRSIKGLLLKNIKDIFKECLSQDHNEVFNKALLNYFISPLSQISDLKYILNRINNEKHDFHKQNQQMYAVLIEALERKLKIGTQNDIPIDQVLIYLQNIPLKTSGINSSETNPTLQELKAIQNINTYSDYLRNSKINMSIYDILHKPQEVFTKLIDYEIEQTNDEDSEVWDSIQNFIEFAVQILMELEEFSQKIYHNRNTNNPINYQTAIFFIFLAKICQNISRIQFVRQLINLPHIKKRYDAFTAEGVVQYLYQWLFSIQSQFSKNRTYIKQLLTLLPTSSNTYKYISSELQFANLLSHYSYVITYPISENVLSFKDLKKIINCLQIDFLLNHRTYSLNELIIRVYEVMIRIQNVIFQQTQRRSQQQDDAIKMDPLRKITLHQVYQIFIIKLLNQSKLKQVIPLIQRIMQIQCENPIYNIIYPILYIIHISSELNEGNKENLIMCVWYYFYQPVQLMNILQYIITTPLSPHQMKNFIQNSLEQGKKKHKGYNKNNFVFRQDYLTFINEKQQYQNIFMTLLCKTAKHIQLCKQQFKHIKYSMIMAMLCNEPYALTKFISCSDQKNVRPIRSLLSYAIMEDVFEPLNLLELGRRIFLVLLEADTKQFPIQAVINQFNKLDLTEDTEIYQYTPPQETDTFQSVMWKSSQAFRKKKDILRLEIQTGGKKSKRLEKDYERKQKIQDLFLNFVNRQHQKQRQPSEYIFSDSDNEEVEEMQIKQTFDRKKSKNQSIFEPKAQREAIFESKKFKKPYSLYRSIQGEFNFGGNSRLFVSTKQQSLSKVSTLRINNNSDLQVRKARSASMRSKQGQQQVPSLNKISLSHDFQLDQVVGSPNLEKSLKPQDLQMKSKSNSASYSQTFGEKNTQKSLQKQIPQMLKHSSIDQDIFQDYPVTTSHNQQAFKTARIQVKQAKQENDFGQEEVQNQTSKLSRDYLINVNEADQIQSNQQIIEIQQTHSQDFNSEYAQIVSRLLQINKQALETGDEQLFNFQTIDKYEQNQYALKQLIKQIYNQNKNENGARIYNVLKFIGQIVGRYMELKISVQTFNFIRKLQQVHLKTISDIKFTDLISDQALVKHYNSQRQIFDEIYGKLIQFVDSQNIYTIQKFINKTFDNSLFGQQILWDFVLDICSKLNNYDREQKKWNIQKIQATLPRIRTQIWNKKFDNFETKVLKSVFKDQLLDIFCSVLDKNEDRLEGIKFLNRVQELYHHQKVEEKLQQFQNE